MGNVTFSYFLKKSFSYISGKVLRTLAHLELEAYSEPSDFQNPGIFLEIETYSEPWYIQKPRHIQNTGKHLRWNVLQE